MCQKIGMMGSLLPDAISQGWKINNVAVRQRRLRQPEPSGGRGYRFNAALFGLPLVDEIMDDAEDIEQLLHGRRIVCCVAVPDPACIGGRMDGALKQGYPAPHFLEERIDRV